MALPVLGVFDNFDRFSGAADTALIADRSDALTSSAYLAAVKR
jgi:hypothetical protein